MTALKFITEDVEVEAEGRAVVLTIDWVRTYLAPSECIDLSRALVKAAAEALGVQA